MAIGRGGSSVKTKLGFLIYGEYGSWKSSFCLESLKLRNENGKPFRVLFIDPENGSIDSYLEKLEEDGCDLRNIYIVYTQSSFEVKEFIRKAKRNEDFYEFDEETGIETDTVYLDADGSPFRPDMIVIDGATVLYIAKQQSMLEFSKKRATVRAKKKELTGIEKEVAIDGASIEIKDYQGLKFDGQSLVMDLLASGKHFAITCRQTTEKESFKDKNGEIKSVSTGKLIPEGYKDMAYNCKTSIQMFIDEEDGVVKGLIDNKDRSLVHKQNEILIEPSILDWQIAIDKNKGKKDFVNNSISDSVDIERKAIEKENAKFEDEFNTLDNSNSSSDLNSVEDYHNAIKEAISKLSKTEVAKRQAEIVKVNLPKAYQKVTDIEQLRAYLKIVS